MKNDKNLLRKIINPRAFKFQIGSQIEKDLGENSFRGNIDFKSISQKEKKNKKKIENNKIIHEYSDSNNNQWQNIKFKQEKLSSILKNIFNGKGMFIKTPENNETNKILKREKGLFCPLPPIKVVKKSSLLRKSVEKTQSMLQPDHFEEVLIFEDQFEFPVDSNKNSEDRVLTIKRGEPTVSFKIDKNNFQNLFKRRLKNKSVEPSKKNAENYENRNSMSITKKINDDFRFYSEMYSNIPCEFD